MSGGGGGAAVALAVEGGLGCVAGDLGTRADVEVPSTGREQARGLPDSEGPRRTTEPGDRPRPETHVALLYTARAVRVCLTSAAFLTVVFRTAPSHPLAPPPPTYAYQDVHVWSALRPAGGPTRAPTLGFGTFANPRTPRALPSLLPLILPPPPLLPRERKGV